MRSTKKLKQLIESNDNRMKVMEEKRKSLLEELKAAKAYEIQGIIKKYQIDADELDNVLKEYANGNLKYLNDIGGREEDEEII